MTPNTTVTLYATPFDISNKYVIAAASEGEALGIVNSYPQKVYTNCYWQRDNDFVFRANGNINEVEQYNYCVYLNNGKYNFAFITQCDYVNDAMTLVHLALDPWLNFAGQYVFHDSPMRRCHIPEAWDSERIYNAVEPYEVAGWYDQRVTFGDPTTYNSYKVYIVTKVPADSYDDSTVSTFYNAVNELIRNGAPQVMTAFWQSVQPGLTRIINIHPQAATALCTLSELEIIVRNFLVNGRSADIIGAYYVPECCLLDFSSGKKSDIEPFYIDKQLNIGAQFPYWYKASYSPQFKRIYINNCGNTHFLPVEEITLTYLNQVGAPNMKFNIGADPSMNGCIYVWPDYTALPCYREHITTSMPWDKVQVTGYGVDVYQQTMNQLQSGKIAYYGASGAVSSLAGLNLTGAVDAVADTIFSGLENLVDANRVAKSGSFATSIGTASMASYNLASELVTIGVQTPKSIAQIYRMFGSFGYTLNGEVVPITFKDLPYWKYYQTQEASIEGRKVPQRYLNQIIQRFNAGIFVFNDTSSYKDFSKSLDNHY